MGTGLNLQSIIPDRKYVCDFLPAAGRRGQRIPEWCLFWWAIKLLHLIETNCPLSQRNAPESFYFFLLCDLSVGLAAVCGLCLGSGAGTQCTLQVPSFCSCGRGEDRGHPHGEGKCCWQAAGVFEEWNYTKREKKGDLPWGEGMLRSLRVDLGVLKQRRKFVLEAAVYESGVCVLHSQPCGEFCSTLTTLPLLEDFLLQYLGEKK